METIEFILEKEFELKPNVFLQFSIGRIGGEKIRCMGLKFIFHKIDISQERKLGPKEIMYWGFTSYSKDIGLESASDIMLKQVRQNGEVITKMFDSYFEILDSFLLQETKENLQKIMSCGWIHVNLSLDQNKTCRNRFLPDEVIKKLDKTSQSNITYR